MNIHRAVDEASKVVESHHLQPDGQYRYVGRPSPDTMEEWQDVVLAGLTGESRPALPRLLRDGLQRLRSASVEPHHDLASPRRPDPEEQQDTLRRVADVLSVGIARIVDLESLDAHCIPYCSPQQDAKGLEETGRPRARPFTFRERSNGTTLEMSCRSSAFDRQVGLQTIRTRMKWTPKSDTSGT